MPYLDESLRAPAELPKMGLRRLISAAVASRFWPTRLCLHRHTTLPFSNRQTCLDCGSSRLYLFHTDFEHADAGITTGPWKRPSLPHNTAAQVAATSAELSTYYVPCRETAVQR